MFLSLTGWHNFHVILTVICCLESELYLFSVLPNSMFFRGTIEWECRIIDSTWLCHSLISAHGWVGRRIWKQFPMIWCDHEFWEQATGRKNIQSSTLNLRKTITTINRKNQSNRSGDGVSLLSTFDWPRNDFLPLGDDDLKVDARHDVTVLHPKFGL